MLAPFAICSPRQDVFGVPGCASSGEYATALLLNATDFDFCYDPFTTGACPALDVTFSTLSDAKYVSLSE